MFLFDAKVFSPYRRQLHLIYFLFFCAFAFLLHVLTALIVFADPCISRTLIFLGRLSSGTQSSCFSFLDDPRSVREIFIRVIIFPGLGLPLRLCRRWGFIAREGAPIRPLVDARG